MRNEITIKIETNHSICKLLWASIPDLECPYGNPINCDILGESGPWRVIGWHKETGPLTTSPEFTTFVLRTCDETDKWRDY